MEYRDHVKELSTSRIAVEAAGDPGDPPADVLIPVVLVAPVESLVVYHVFVFVCLYLPYGRWASTC